MIHDEWTSNLLRERTDLTPAQMQRTRSEMNRAIPKALVTGFEPLMATLQLPDPDDRHVLAAALHSKASHIITFNLKDFPTSVLQNYGVVAEHPDVFLLRCCQTLPDAALLAVRSQRQSLKKPPQSAVLAQLRALTARAAETLLATLERQGLPHTIAWLQPHLAEL
jgi:PIN domain